NRATGESELHPHERPRTRPRDQVIGRRDKEPLVGQLTLDVGEKRIDASACPAARGNQLAVRHHGCASAYFHLSAHPCALKATALRQRGSVPDGVPCPAVLMPRSAFWAQLSAA